MRVITLRHRPARTTTITMNTTTITTTIANTITISITITIIVNITISYNQSLFLLEHNQCKDWTSAKPHHGETRAKTGNGIFRDGTTTGTGL